MKKKIGQLKCDVRSCRYTNFILKQKFKSAKGSGPPGPRTTYSVIRGPGNSPSDKLLTKMSKKWPRDTTTRQAPGNQVYFSSSDLVIFYFRKRLYLQATEKTILLSTN